MNQAEREYVAFISYRHKEWDMAVAKRVHALIEKYRVPKALRKNGEKRLGIAFRDQEELPVSENLSTDICQALDRSAFLVVVCTPDTPGSLWVNREIDYFLKNHSHSRVLAILASGSPETSFPRALTHIGGGEDASMEPLAANVCADSLGKSLRLLKKESIRLFAAMLGCPYDALARREQKRRQKRRAAVLLTAFSILVGYAGILLRSNLLIEAKNRELEQLNQSLREQKRDLQLNESMYLTRDAEAAAAANDPVQAIEYALAALPKQDGDRPYYAPAESALMAALGVFETRGAFVNARSRDALLSAPARSIRATEDGSAVIVVDEYDGVSSYDPFTGALNWQVALSAEKSSAYLFARGSTEIALDEKNDLVFAMLENELFAIRLNTGSLVWQTGLQYGFDQFARHDASDALVCLQRKAADSFNVWNLDVVVLDALTGAEKQRCAFDRPYAGGTPYRESQKTDDPRQNAAFSEDGKRFFGVIYETGGDTAVLHYYVYELESNTVRVVYSEPEEDYDEILWMGLSGEGENCLTVIKQVSGNGRMLNIRLIDPDAGELLYEGQASPQDGPDGAVRTKSYAVLPWRKDLLLVSACDQLYLIRLSTGEVLRQARMASQVLSLYKIDDRFFGFVLADGTCEAGWHNDGGFQSSKRFGASLSLGAASAACAGKGGFISPVTEESTVKGFLLGNRADGFGYVVLLDAEDRRKMRFVHLAVIGKLTEDKTLSLGADAMKALYADATDGLSLLLNPDRTILYAWEKADEANQDAYRFTWQLFDPKADEPLKTWQYSGSYAFSGWTALNGEKLILHSAGGGVSCYDVQTGQTEVLGEEKITTMAHGTLFGEDMEYVASLTKADSARRGDGAVLTAYCDGESLSLWLDGVLRETVSLPSDTMTWQVKHSLSMDSVLKTGGNGLVLFSDYGKEPDGSAIARFMLYNTEEKTWVGVEDAAHGDAKRIFALGEEDACFAVYEQGLLIHLYRLSGGVQTIKTGVASDAVADFRFLCGDRYLAVCSKEGALEIFDTENAARVYAGRFDADFSFGRLSAAMDEENQRMYVIDHKARRCVCLDARSWTKLAEIANVYGYDPKENSLYLYRYGMDAMILRPAPSLQTLMELGCRVLEN